MIIANDFQALDNVLHLSKAFSWNYSQSELINALKNTGNMAFILPMLPKFHEDRRVTLLNTLPLVLDYKEFKQVKSIYFDKSLKIDLSTKYFFVSCAHLILQVDEVVEICKEFNMDTDALFYSTFLKGDTEKALYQAEMFLVKHQDKEQHKRKELPGIFGLLYALVLISAGGSGNLTSAATFVRSAIRIMPDGVISHNPYVLFGKIILLFINHKLGKKTTSKREIINIYQNQYHKYFLTAVLSWFGKPLNEERFFDLDNEKEEFEYRASEVMKYNDTVTIHNARLKELREKFDFIPLAEIVKPKEAWEDVLTILANELAKKSIETDEGKTVSKKLIWLFDAESENCVKCLEQTRNKTGWSKGKERSLVRMLSACPEFATVEDKKVLSCMIKHQYFNEIYIRDWDKLILALASHPEVYTITEPHLPISFKIQEAQIQIDKTNKGAKIKLNPKSPDRKIIKETPTSYTFIKWSVQALRVYNVLKDSNVNEINIPEKGIDTAKPIFEKLNEMVPVTGNFAQNSAKSIKSDNIPVVQLTPVNNQLHIQLLIEVIENQESYFTIGVGADEVMVKKGSGVHVKVKRDKEKEREIQSDLSRRITWFEELEASGQLFIHEEGDMLDFLSDIKEYAPEVKLVWPKGERMRVAKALLHTDFKVNVKQAQDWFAIDGEVVVDDNTKLSISQILESSKGGTLKYIQLDDKTYLSICKDLQNRLASLNTVTHTKGKKLLVHPLGTGNIENFVVGIENFKTDNNWKQHIKNLDALKSYKPSLPDNLQAELRPYQEEGVLWLDRLHHWGVGACLADDMGLGKTIQAISLLLKYAQNGSSVVLAPSSVCNNWIKELVRFAPSLNPVVFRDQNRKKILNGLAANDVLIVSYGLIQSNPDLLDKIDWNIVVLDEAHAIKNANTVRSKAVMKLKAKFKIITTGTPIQNHLGELWNLFQFINPGMLGSSDQFVKKYIKNDNSAQNKQIRKSLSRYIAPFILRRNKNEVLEDLPEKTEITLQVALSDSERAMYEELRLEALEQLSKEDGNEGPKHMQILAHITKLRQMSCNPQLIAPDCDIPSSKLDALETLVDDLIDAKHKALVFSQFTKHLALIRVMLDRKGVSYQYLDGSTPIKAREKAIENFQHGKSDLFLISLKAGGVGLNLTAADYVIHMDPWWNPAIEDQASDRAHRIGQQRPVTIYRIIAENTIEEKIVKMHHNKRDLANKLLADTDQSAKISSEELMTLIADMGN